MAYGTVFTLEEMQKVLDDPVVRELFESHVESFNVTALPADVFAESDESSLFSVQVVKKSPGRWAVQDGMGRRQYNAAGERQYESIPSERSDDFKDEFRHDLDAAVKLAFKVAPKLRINGFSVEGFVEWFRSISKD